VSFLDRYLQVGAGNVLIDRLTEMVVADRLIQDQVPDGLQQLRVGFDHGAGHFRAPHITLLLAVVG
jgi:hypothetical protein